MTEEKQWVETGMEIAVVGMAGRFPGAATIEKYWENIANGTESVTRFTDKELRAAGIEESLLNQPDYVKAKPIIDQVSDFDADFFGYTPREAALMDPQIRLMHECTWEALEHAGCDAERFKGLIGLYAGASSNLSWMEQHSSSLRKKEDVFQIMHLNDSSFASRIAYKLNLKGPSVSVQTACSTSLVAIHMACQGLLGGECDLALAGGVTLNLPHVTGYLYQEGMIYSSDGHCRPFDESANGTIFGEGVGVVALKRLADAKADGDEIYAVIKGSAINNDGNNKAGYTAPSAKGQADVIQTAMEMAETEPETIGYIEAHGTGTPVGDPIEVEALTRAFQTDKKSFCRLGSVKANIGHLDAASGVAGFIKTVMMLRHKMLPPAPYFKKPNPRIQFENTPFLVNTELTEWESAVYPRRAGVSSFGIGGANAHIVLEESPQKDSLGEHKKETELIVLSARTERELARSAENLSEFLKRHPETPVSAAARTLQLGRRPFGHRMTFAASRTDEVIRQLSRGFAEQNVTEASALPSRTMFVFPGAHQDGLSAFIRLYQAETLFRNEADRYLSSAQAELGRDLISCFEAIVSGKADDHADDQPELSLVLLFVMEYASAQYLQHIGLQPDVFMGRGFGELTAACAAGVFTFAEAVRAACKRGELIAAAPAGKMLGVSLSEEEIEPYLKDTLSLALADEQYCIVSGLSGDVGQLQEDLRKGGVASELFATNTAFQSYLHQEAAREFKSFLHTLPLKTPNMPIISSYTGEVMTGKESKDPQYWADQLCRPIRFAEKIASYVKREPAVCVDVRLIFGAAVFTPDQTAEIAEEITEDGVLKLHIYGALWRLGAEIDFSILHHPKSIRRTALPTYPFTKRHFPLPEEDRKRKETAASDHRDAVNPSLHMLTVTEIEKKISEVVKQHFGFESVDEQVPFFELGATSLDMSQLAAKLTEHLNWKIEPVLLYQFAAIRSLASHLHEQYQNADRQEGANADVFSDEAPARHEAGRPSDIAIIGMAGRFPGAAALDEFWNMLINGEETIRHFTDDELKKAGTDEQLLKHPDFVKAKGIIDNCDKFDADFFQYSAREAELMDPQLRLLHECAWEALEDAGCDPDRTEGSIGVYTGTSPNLDWISRFAGKLGGAEQFSAMLLNDREFFSTQLAYKLNLHGPSITMQTACSTSLVNIGAACQALQNGACSTAIAGGVTVSTPLKTGYVHQDGMIQSRDGHCRPFDRDAGGTVFGDGAGIVVLKRYEDAVKEGHTIHAVIKGIGINNDGGRKAGFTAPSVEGQAEVLKQAYQAAGIQPASVGYIEAHGTGTKMGDPIEVEALSQVFQHAAPRSIPIGSVKSNVGHLNSAAGIAGLFKAILSLKHKTILPSLHFKNPNPNINFDKTPFYVNTEPAYWKENAEPRRAGVSSFGIGGTNAHLVIEEETKTGREASERAHHLFLLSAKTETALDQMTANMKKFLKNTPAAALEDAAYTLQVGRKQFVHRKAVVLTNADDWTEESELTASYSGGRRTVALMFSGQGSQYINMMKELYEAEPVFKREIDRCFDIAEQTRHLQLRQAVFPENAESAVLTETALVQPLLFIFEYALAKLLESAGVTPDYMIGHSIGEYTAACLSGVFSLETAIQLVAERGRLMQGLKPGTMMSVLLPEEELMRMLPECLSLAAVNAENACVVSGEEVDIDRFSHLLEEKEILFRKLNTSHAFHSYMMDPVLADFEQVLKQSDLNSPRIPFLSNVTGTWIKPEQAADPAYWVKHLRGAVRFHEGLSELLTDENVLCIEAGPGNTLSALCKRHPKRTKDHGIANMVRHVHETDHDHAYFLKKLGELWLNGCEINWRRYYGDEQKHLIPLPHYPFEKKRYWLDAAKQEEVFTSSAEPNQKLPMEKWFYLPSWKRQVKPEGVKKLADEKRTTLVFHEETKFSFSLVQKLEQNGMKTVIVKKGARFEKNGPGSYTIHPASGSDYEKLFASLQEDQLLPQRVIHTWNVSEGLEEQEQSFAISSESGYYSLIFTAQAAARQKQINNCELFILTSGLHEVTGGEFINAEKSAVLGPIKVIPQEYNHIKCWNIDIPPVPESLTWKEEELIDQIISETETPGKDQIIAYRHRKRWVQMYQPVTLNKKPGLPHMIRSGGVYLITGGLGGIGFVLSKLLAKEGQVKLILTGRSGLPPRDQWAALCSGSGENEAIVSKIMKVKELERLGAEVTAVSADAGNLQDMQKVVKDIYSAYGRLNGVFHAAGLPGSSSFRAIKDIPDEARNGEEQFQSKVKGLKVLETLLEGEEIDFCFLFSSISAALGGLGFSAYSAANIYMDAFAQRMNQKSKAPWICVNWDAWNFWGDLDSAIGQSIAELAIIPDEGAELFQYVLSADSCRHLLVSTGSLNHRIRQWISMETKEAETKKTSIHTRPELKNPYVAPRNQTEQVICRVWQDFMGLEQVGIHDNFFDLGASSLDIVQVTNRLNQELGTNEAVVTLFTYPSVSALAQYIQPDSGNGEDENEEEMAFASGGRRKARIRNQRDKRLRGGE
ncbi:acyltransferase domain-containing protein [Bacillus sp. YC2]|uniref:type I polyketide synthase n=1 Tax=Bacillus sp. YC2 TaxID=2861287 RepID=UPI001CA6DF88|nr:type I polyketide synthase [Bacillus sp. YC2]MBY8914126.1 acyltransferase domain-containing protein [Bacillus sp. YC2]